MNRLNWVVIQLFERFSLLGLLSWIVLFATGWLVWSLLLPANEQLMLLQQERQHQPKMVQQQPAEPVEYQFLKQIPEVDEVSQAINSLFTLTQTYGLELDAVSYKDEVKVGEPVLRYVIQFGLNGDYPTIQQFLAELLVAQPYLALQAISFERESVEQADVNVQFKMSLFLNHE